MNCKQGDLAIVVRGKYNAGKIVRCVSLVGSESFWDGYQFSHGPIWNTDIPLSWGSFKFPDKEFFINEAPDRCLKPIPDDLLTQEEKDEIMKGMPVTA